jgi:rod shape-determining protein MreC
LRKFIPRRLISPLFFLLFVLLLSSAIPSLKTGFVVFLRYPLAAVNLLRRELTAAVFFHRNFIRSERLGKENGLLRLRLNGLEETRLENERLKDLLAFKRGQPRKLLAARVIGRSQDNGASSAIIDKGSRQGIRKGMAVVASQGLAGRVVESGPSTSKILFITDSNLSVSALCQRSRQEGLVSGTLGSYLVMRYLPDKPDLQPQDKIITSGLNAVYPKGILVGTVVQLRKEFSGLSFYAIIKPAVIFSALEEVLVVMD